MAGASSPPHHRLAFLCFCYCMLVHCIRVAYAFSFTINFATNNTNPCGFDLQCRDDASYANPMMEVTVNNVVRPREYSKGRVWYARPVPLWDDATGEVASFATTFDFKIEPDPSKESMLRDKNIYPYGDGMAFFIAPYSGDVLGSGDGGGTLGLVNNSIKYNATGDKSFVAVEFDTYQNEWDHSKQHVGIDVNSIMSEASTNTSPEGEGALVSSNVTMTARITFDNRTRLLAVDLDVNGTSYRVNHTVDLRKLLPEEVVVGFSAATGWAAELHRISFWSFNSTLEKKAPAPAAPQPSPVKPEPSTGLLLKVAAPVVAVSVCAALLGLLLCCLRQKRRRKEAPSDGSDSDEEADFERGVAGPRRYRYRELAAATGDFSEDNRLGKGGFGSVYQGTLQGDGDGGRPVMVAVKKLSSDTSCQGRKEFEAEVRIISRLRHRNLVQLLGWCDSAKGLLLVYELMPQGSLDRLIHNSPRLLTWPERYKIIMGLGSALTYLHREWEQCVVHGDIKPSNIMLESSYNTKLGDFGLARLIDHEAAPRTTVNVLGTAGYIDPDFVNTRRPSPESDVYSFGIVLLEIISARQPVSHQPPFVLLKWVWSLYSRGATVEAVDARLRGSDDADDRRMERALVVGLWCAHHDPGARPSIADALRVLQSEDAKLPELPQNMYRYEAATLPTFVSMDESWVSGSSFSSGVRSSATTDTTHSSEPLLAN